jgi:RNA polymerase sigma-54 factor
MGLEIKQSMKLTQALVMTPQLQQAIKLLQLSRLELEQTIQEELLQNPLLEEAPELTPGEELPSDLVMTAVEPPAPEAQPEPAKVEEVKGEEGKNDFDWDGYLDKYQDQPRTPSGRDTSTDELPGYQETLTRGESLADHLELQLRMDDLSEEERSVGLDIIGNLTDDGYLERTEDGGDALLAIAMEIGVSAEVASRVLRRIQHYDPPGCGARDLQECLVIQANAWLQKAHGDPSEADGEVVLNILRQVRKRTPEGAVEIGFMKELEAKNYPAIGRELGISLQEVVAAVKVITSFEPKPGRNYTTQDPQYITPDVYVHKMGDRYTIVLNDDGLSKLRISDHYRRVLRNGDARQTKDYIQDKLRSAVWLIRSIHQRQRTIYKVTESIVKFQQEFLDKGVQYLKPLILRNVADDIGMHESTVSRVTTNKYVHTPQGIYELKYFFNSSIARQSGDDIASEAVKSKIKALVAQEPGDVPYSDQKIVELLERQGINIARRTVAKYREALGILPSSKRRRYY